MNEDNTKRLRVLRLKDLNKELDNMEIHVLKAKAGHIEDQAGFIVRSLNKDTQTLNVMQDIILHSLRALGIRIVEAHANEVGGTVRLVEASHVALS